MTNSKELSDAVQEFYNAFGKPPTVAVLNRADYKTIFGYDYEEETAQLQKYTEVAGNELADTASYLRSHIVTEDGGLKGFNLRLEGKETGELELRAE